MYETPVYRAGSLTLRELPAQVMAVEPLGAETLLMLKLDGLPQEVIARVGRETEVRRGERLPIAIDLATTRLFDPETTRAVGARSGPRPARTPARG